jgi:hypothetical protein
VEQENLRLMMLFLSLVLGLIPLAGVVWTVMNGTITTVDGLFTSLILLTLSGILFLNALLELKAMKKSATPPVRKTS